MGAPEVQAFLSDLAVRGEVSASTQNQALNVWCSFTARENIFPAKTSTFLHDNPRIFLRASAPLR